MKNFKELSKESYYDNEQKYVDYWKEINVLDKSIEQGDKHWVFYDGPAFANGFPGLHHMVAKNLKDIVCKYKAMNGYKIIRKIGFYFLSITNAENLSTATTIASLTKSKKRKSRICPRIKVFHL